jgi:hypothetical protein
LFKYDTLYFLQHKRKIQLSASSEFGYAVVSFQSYSHCLVGRTATAAAPPGVAVVVVTAEKELQYFIKLGHISFCNMLTKLRCWANK